MAQLDMNGNLLKTANARFIVRSKKSGQSLGYAMLLPEVTVDDGDALLVPWPEDLQPSNPVIGINESTEDTEAVAELNISSSVSSEGDASDIPEKLFQINGPGCKQVNDHNPTPNSDSVLISSLPSSPVLKDNSNHDHEKSIIIPNEVQLKRKNEVTNNEEYLDGGDQSSFSKIKKKEETETDPSLEERPNLQENVGMYDMFVEFVDEKNNVEIGLPKYRKKVKCVLCSDEKVISYGNVGRHIEYYHLPSVVCDICNCKISKKRISYHMEKVHSNQQSENVNDKLKSSKRKRRKRDSTIQNGLTEEKASSSINTNPNNSKTELFTVNTSSLDLNREYCNNDITEPVVCTNIDAKNQTSNCVDEGKGIAEVTAEEVVVPSSRDESRESTVSKEQVIVTMTSDSLKEFSIKMGVEKGVSMKNAMRKFGKRFSVNYKELKFMLENVDSQEPTELLGDEIVGDLKSRNITVVGKLTS